MNSCLLRSLGITKIIFLPLSYSHQLPKARKPGLLCYLQGRRCSREMGESHPLWRMTLNLKTIVKVTGSHSNIFPEFIRIRKMWMVMTALVLKGPDIIQVSTKNKAKINSEMWRSSKLRSHFITSSKFLFCLKFSQFYFPDKYYWSSPPPPIILAWDQIHS